MYWMLLPPSANAGRHVEVRLLPLGDRLIEVLRAGWGVIMDLVASRGR